MLRCEPLGLSEYPNLLPFTLTKWRYATRLQIKRLQTRSEINLHTPDSNLISSKWCLLLFWRRVYLFTVASPLVLSDNWCFFSRCIKDPSDFHAGKWQEDREEEAFASFQSIYIWIPAQLWFLMVAFVSFLLNPNFKADVVRRYLAWITRTKSIEILETHCVAAPWW